MGNIRSVAVTVHLGTMGEDRWSKTKHPKGEKWEGRTKEPINIENHDETRKRKRCNNGPVR